MSEYVDSREGMTRSLHTSKASPPINQIFLSSTAAPLTYPTTTRLTIRVNVPKPHLTLEAGLLGPGDCIGLMYVLFTAQERWGRPDTCHSTHCPIKINTDNRSVVSHPL